MSAPRLVNGRWAVAWSFNVHDPLARACDTRLLAERIRLALTARRCIPVQERGRVNPLVTVEPIALRGRALVTVLVVMNINHPSGSVQGSIVNLDAAQAFKRATGVVGEGLGTERMARAMVECDDIGEVLRWEPPVTRVCADYRRLGAGEWPTLQAETALGRAGADAGTRPISESNDPNRIGQSNPGPSLWDLIPREAKIAGGVLLGIGSAAAVGYALRPVAGIIGALRENE